MTLQEREEMTVICRRKRWTSKKKIIKSLSLLIKQMPMLRDLVNKKKVMIESWLNSQELKKKLLILMKELEILNGNMKLGSNSSNILKERNNNCLTNSTDLFMKSIKRQVLEILFWRRNTKQFRKVWRQKMHRLTNFWLLLESTHKHLELSGLLLKKLRT